VSPTGHDSAGTWTVQPVVRTSQQDLSCFTCALNMDRYSPMTSAGPIHRGANLLSITSASQAPPRRPCAPWTVAVDELCPGCISGIILCTIIPTTLLLFWKKAVCPSRDASIVGCMSPRRRSARATSARLSAVRDRHEDGNAKRSRMPDRLEKWFSQSTGPPSSRSRHSGTSAGHCHPPVTTGPPYTGTCPGRASAGP